MMPSVQAVREYIHSFWRVEERLSNSEWVARNIFLPHGKQESEPGRVNWKRRPQLREVLDALGDPDLTDIVFVGPTRVGKTFLLRMAMACSIAKDPASSMWIDSTEDKAKSVMKRELRPMIEANECLRSRMPRDRRYNTESFILFPGAALGMVGGNSEAQVAGDTVERLFGNELDKWKGATEKEASIAELARHRTESFSTRKHMWSCTPTIEEAPTWQFFLRGDQRKRFVPCPRCDVLQELIFDSVRWDPAARISSGKWDLKRVKESARYSCVNVNCSAHDPHGEQCCGWTEPERVMACQDERSEWRPTAVGEPGWRSYHLNGLYGPLASNSCGALAVDFLSARNAGFYADRQDFWNSRMGMPWKDEISDITVEKFSAREASYCRGAVPDDFIPAIVITGFDVQSNRLPYVVRAFDLTGRSYLVDHGDAPSWRDLEQIQDDYHRKWPRAASYVIGDINYEDRRAEALEQIYMRAGRGWYGAEAFEQAKDLVKLEEANVYLGGKLQGKGHVITKLVISAYEFKVELEKRFSGEIPNWFVYQLELTASQGEIDERREYYKQLLDERRVPRKHRVAGKPPFEWRSRTKNNHAFDCEVYILALFWVLQKSRSAAAKKAPDSARRVVEVKR
jgi:phage terminase large subunit GpA-like protein